MENKTVRAEIAALVERLREVWKDPSGNIRHEAADALERVGAYYDQMQQAYREQKWLEAELTAATAENERLREALEEIAKYPTREQAIYIARAALNAKD